MSATRLSAVASALLPAALLEALEERAAILEHEAGDASRRYLAQRRAPGAVPRVRSPHSGSCQASDGCRGLRNRRVGATGREQIEDRITLRGLGDQGAGLSRVPACSSPKSGPSRIGGRLQRDILSCAHTLGG